MIELEFLRYCLGVNDTVPFIKEKEWDGVFCFCIQQSLVGIGFGGIEKLPSEQKCPKPLLLKWFALAEQIKQRNQLLNLRCVELVEELQQNGFRSCILKGQGNALLYDVRMKNEEGRSMALLRQPGDVDVWVIKEQISNKKKFRDEIINYAKKQNLKSELRIYHVGYEWKGVSVELHFMPAIMNNPRYNRRIQKWFIGNISCVMVDLPNGVGTIPIPTIEFNLVFQLAHMMHHFFDEGIGLRQMIDYYYLLRKAKDDVRCKKEDIRAILKYLNLYKFAGAVMYIMKEVLELDEDYLIVLVDEKRGKSLLNEILKGGNFGKYSGLTKLSPSGKYLAKTWRNLKFVSQYPAEALCEPFFRTWHFFWRLRYNDGKR
jgi:hypothetical protein